MMFSTSMLTPLIINIIFAENFWMPFVAASCCTAFIGFGLWFSCRFQHNELKVHDGFLLVVLFWVVLSFFASLPLIFAIWTYNHSITDAVFESVSGFTTTGASIINNLDDLPHSILFYRQQLQFLGGMGIVVLAIAILPMLGIGGMQLYRAETPGPMKDSKLTPRIAQTAKALWSIYLFFTLGCMLCYWLAGMNWFDALGESFATISTGGFSMHNTNFSYYHSNLIKIIACFFMLLGGTNFGLHFLVFQKKDIFQYFRNEEFKTYIIFLFLTITLVALSLVGYKYLYNPQLAFLDSAFNVISMVTTTGFISTPFDTWPTFLPILLLLLSILGGCAASTSGGIKFLRAILIFKHCKRETARLLHPHAVIPIKFSRHTLPESVLQSTWAFVFVFIALFFILILLLMALNNDFITSFSASLASLTNSGIGIGKVNYNFSDLNQASKWILIFAMIAGRLEIFSLLVLFSRYFWIK